MSHSDIDIILRVRAERLRTTTADIGTESTLNHMQTYELVMYAMNIAEDLKYFC